MSLILALLNINGKRNTNKFTKLYDKTKESHLDYDLTRIEFTFDRNELEFKNLPKFCIFGLLDSKDISLSNLSQKDLVLVSMLTTCEEQNFYFKNLPYRFRKKIEPIINDCAFEPDYNLIKSVRDLALYFEI